MGDKKNSAKLLKEAEEDLSEDPCSTGRIALIAAFALSGDEKKAIKLFNETEYLHGLLANCIQLILIENNYTLAHKMITALKEKDGDVYWVIKTGFYHLITSGKTDEAEKWLVTMEKENNYFLGELYIHLFLAKLHNLDTKKQIALCKDLISKRTAVKERIFLLSTLCSLSPSETEKYIEKEGRSLLNDIHRGTEQDKDLPPVFSVYKNISKEDLFDEWIINDCKKDSVKLFAQFISALGNKEKTEKILKEFTRLLKAGKLNNDIRDVGYMLLLFDSIKAKNEAKDVEEGLTTLLKKMKTDARFYAYEKLINISLTAGNFKRATGFWKKMTVGHQPTQTRYFIEAYMREGMMDDALSMLPQLTGNDTDKHEILINELAKHGVFVE